jgi:hypothetical protein
MKVIFLISLLAVFVVSGCIEKQAEVRNIQVTPQPTPTPTIPIQHVVTIVFENQPLSDILSNGPYFNYLYNTYGTATNFYAACHPSASNYLAMTSGNTWQCGSDALNLYTTTNIGTLLEDKNISQGGNLSWYGFMESMPSPCYRSDSGEYAYRHNPFVYYSDLVNSNLCTEHDMSLDTWNNLVNSNDSNQIPNYSYISPNVLNDAHDTNVAYADNWLKNFLSPLLAKPWANNTVFFITWDESVSSDSSGFNGFNGGHTYLVAVWPYSKGLSIVNDVTDYNLITGITSALYPAVGRSINYFHKRLYRYTTTATANRSCDQCKTR